MKRRKSNRRAGIAAFDQDEKVVLIKRGSPPAKGIWTLPMGGIEDGEIAAEAAKREAYEETGLLVEVTEELGVFYSNNIELTVFVGKIIGGVLNAGDDASDAMFVGMDTIPHYISGCGEPTNILDEWAIRLNNEVFEKLCKKRTFINGTAL